MAWIESHQSLGTHRKLLRLMSTLHIKDSEAVGHLHFLWWWSLDNAPDGNLSGLTFKEIAVAGHWKGNPDHFVQALVACGWVDKTESLLFLHDWQAYAGKLIDRRESNRERQSAFRKRKNNSYVTVTSQLRNGATVPNSTVPVIPPISPKGDLLDKKDFKTFELPEWIKKEDWAAFREMRLKIRAPLTDTAVKLILKELERFRAAGDDAGEVLNQSIMHGWRGVFPLKRGGNGNGKNHPGHLPTKYERPPGQQAEPAGWAESG